MPVPGRWLGCGAGSSRLPLYGARRAACWVPALGCGGDDGGGASGLAKLGWGLGASCGAIEESVVSSEPARNAARGLPPKRGGGFAPPSGGGRCASKA